MGGHSLPSVSEGEDVRKSASNALSALKCLKSDFPLLEKSVMNRGRILIGAVFKSDFRFPPRPYQLKAFERT